MKSKVDTFAANKLIEHSTEVLLEHRIGNRRAERLRINGSAKFSFSSSIEL